MMTWFTRINSLSRLDNSVLALLRFLDRSITILAIRHVWLDGIIVCDHVCIYAAYSMYLYNAFVQVLEV